MTPGARLSAAMEVLADIEAKRRPAGDALKDWGLAHRFAGSGDRAVIAGLVYDALRRRLSAAWIMGNASPRAVLLGMLRLARGYDEQTIDLLFDGSTYAPSRLDPDERTRLAAADLATAPLPVIGDYPEWLDSHFARSLGDARGEELAALAQRAPVDLRVNTLKTHRAKAASLLSHFRAEPCRWSPIGLRIALDPEAKNPAIHVEPAFLKGLIEVQDEGSQLAALLCGVTRRSQAIDLCAGAGGKTLVLAAMMENHGQIYATDSDKHRLAAIHARIARAGVRNVQVRTPTGSADALHDLEAKADLVLIDAPCTGTGTWRRNPDAKWRMRPGSLAERQKEQVVVLDRAAALVKPGGRLVYVTCSLLDEENGEQVRAFLGRHPGFAIVPPVEVTGALGEEASAFGAAVRISVEGLLMTPLRTGTDGFFVAVLTRNPA